MFNEAMSFRTALLGLMPLAAAATIYAAHAYAQTAEPQTNGAGTPTAITCPIDGNQFTYTLKQPPKGHLIEDRDYCLRVVPEITSFKTVSIYPARLAVCTKCGLAAPPDSPLWSAGGDFATWYSSKFATQMQGGAHAVRPEWELFERYALSLERLGADERDVALAWLDASFCARTGFWGEFPGWEGDSAEAVAELSDATPLGAPYPSPRMLYEESIEIPSYFHDLLFNARRAGPALGVLSAYWLARGETARVQNALNAMAEIELAMDATLAGSGPKLVRAIGASGLAQKMREYQESAATYFEIALDKGQITSLEAPLVYYHLGELNRRAGELKKAERYYRLSHSHHAVSEKIKERAHSGLELVIQDEELYQELIDFVKADFIDDLPLDSIIEELEQEEAEPEDAEEIEPEEDEKEKPRYVGEAIDIGKKKTRQ